MTVLMLGQHLELGNYRAEFLKSHGISVIFPPTRETALEAIHAGGYDSVILSYSLSNKTATELMELIRQVCPDCALICITEQRWDDREFNPDATVLASDPPQSLLDAIHRVHNHQSGKRIKRIK